MNNEFWIEFLGNHTIEFHSAGILYALIGSLLAKYYLYRIHKAERLGVASPTVFSWGKWFKENFIDITISIIIAFIFVRFLDVFLHWLNPKIESAFNFKLPITDDQVFYYLIVGLLIQLWIHKKFTHRKKG